MNVGEDTTLGDGDVTQKLVQLLIVTDGELQVTRNDTGLLVVTGGVSSQLENFSSEVLEDGSQVDGSTLNHVRHGNKTRLGYAFGAYRHQHAERSCPCAKDGVHDRRGKRDRPWTSGCRESISKIERVRSQKVNKARTTASSWHRWPCLRICLQSF